MTGDPRVFDELLDYVRDPYITIANEAPSHMKGEDTISFTLTLSLVYALLVLHVKCNFLPYVLLFSRHSNSEDNWSW